MSWNKDQPLATDSLATSQGLISGNFYRIEAALGSSTLSAGISLAQGDMLYASDGQTLQKLAKASASAILTNFSTNWNPSWHPTASKVPALNADLLDGYDTSTTAVENKIPIMGASGYMPDGSVDTGALKTTDGTVAFTAGNGINPGGQWSFSPGVKRTAAVGTSPTYCHFYTGALTDTTQYTFSHDSAQSVTFTVTYVTSSGQDYWIFLMLAKDDLIIKGAEGEVEYKKGAILGYYEAPDHPSFNNGGDYTKLQQPFGHFDPAKHEIIILDNDTIAELKQESKATGKAIIDLVYKDYKVDKEKPYKPLHSGKFINGQPEKIQELPNYIKVKSLKKK